MGTKAGVVKLAEVKVEGVVQGVGFRPFVYQLATEHNLAGWVRNTSGNVEIEVEGEAAVVERFVSDLRARTPPMARIESLSVIYHPPRGYERFEIRESFAQVGQYQLVSPDIATCAECQRELLDPKDRRYRYPFTNCTNCGPRFTIIEDIPYDRPRTTMKKFVMCSRCQREYDDPLDRRFHAQPNACPECGPSLSLLDAAGNEMGCPDVIAAASALLKEGKVLAIKGLGGFHLACDATSAPAVKLLRARKRRPFKPLAVMLATMNEVGEHCRVSPEEEELLLSPQASIVLLPWRKPTSVVEEVAPNNNYLGVMLPYTPLHHVLLRQVGRPLVMTSGNLSEEPIAKDNDEAVRRLGGIADYLVVHNRDIYARYDDSVYIVEGRTPRALRRARSHAPFPIHLPFSSRQVLACGAELKNTFCITKEGYAFLSQHIGDLENLETLEHFENTIELYKRLFRLEPRIVAYDMHPDYLATRYALELKERVGEEGWLFVPVQHHHAHVVACLVENGVSGPAIGVSLDGTGYGPDGTIWGGEFLVADWRGFERRGHLEYVPMAGGTAAIERPYRMALSYLYTLLGPDFSVANLSLLSKVDGAEVDIIKRQLEQRLNSPLTSSCGRLFDAVSAIAGVRGVVDYEAQAAIELEMLAAADAEQGGYGSYPFAIEEQDGVDVVRLGELLQAVVDDVGRGVGAAVISARFHGTMAEIVVEMCRRIARDSGLKLVALSGGCFQNRLFFCLAVAGLEGAGFKVLTHSLVPTNDGAVSLGQAVVANFAAESGALG